MMLDQESTDFWVLIAFPDSRTETGNEWQVHHDHMRLNALYVARIQQTDCSLWFENTHWNTVTGIA